MAQFDYPQLEQEDFITFTLGWSIFFFVLYNAAWSLLVNRSATFRQFSRSLKADNVSRVVSTVHIMRI